MTAFPESLLNDLRALVPQLIGENENTQRNVEILGRDEGSRTASGFRTKDGYNVLSTVTGLIKLSVNSDTSTRNIGGQAAGQREVDVILPFDADMSGAVAVRIEDTDTVYELLEGQDNRDTTMRVTTTLRARQVMRP
ncbi:hypothetical protein UFOVP1476_45 [uncultured Caudovirales phage]|uniref:Uncharacterized protein n=2 Tax=uncultured Caudovirales phage TaxID=2100421 RepID=A0A6J5SQ88_9CAUD|nr:hypothetical protein UFOVP1381_19 [uncultured Caudovirales phage]CAB4216116.1 hypothetical protein UFOVP1476_45 [uncultured Caudovirales phage]